MKRIENTMHKPRLNRSALEPFTFMQTQNRILIRLTDWITHKCHNTSFNDSMRLNKIDEKLNYYKIKYVFWPYYIFCITVPFYFGQQ